MGSALLLVHLVKVIDEIRPQPCGTEEKENFSRTRSQMLAALPLPRRSLAGFAVPKALKYINDGTLAISGRRIRQIGGKIIGVMSCTFSEHKRTVGKQVKEIASQT